MQKTTRILSKLSLLTLLFFPALLVQLASQSEIVISLSSTVQSHLLLYLVTLLILKTSSIVYPPLPGVVLTLASIPLIGWEKAYLIDITGSTIGATISFFLGKKYGSSILIRVIGKSLTDKIVRVKLKQKNQIEAAIFLRFASGGMLSDGLAWGASLIGFRYLSFIIGYVVSHIITTLPVFYLVAASISFDSWIVVAGVAILAWFIIYKFKGRYFE